MAYSPLKQACVDPTTTSSHDLTLGTTPSPRRADVPLPRLSHSFEDFVAESFEEGSDAQDENADTRVARFLSSLTSSSHQSYDMVEDDDYEVTDQQATPTFERYSRKGTLAMAQTRSIEDAQYESPLRTASISRQLPLNHPIPDLQSLQGAYIKNVERLEESAERLSMKSSLEGEVQRMKREQRHRERTASQSSSANAAASTFQRRVSTKSLASSVADINSKARPGGDPAATFVTSPVGSLKSPQSGHSGSQRRVSRSSKLSQSLPQAEHEGRPLDSVPDMESLSHVPDHDPRPGDSPSFSNASHIDRPTTSGSGDTYQQATTLFTDFDGVHFAPNQHPRASRRISLTRPPRARDSRAFKEPQPGEEMIYYPAPVPVMLNLPVRLSRLNWSEQEKKRLQALSSIPDEMRKSAAWLANEEGIPAANKRNSVLPPQLRASAFFDHRGTTQDVELTNGSAVATLDSILDAAAHAPVSAFTDHPIAGHLGDDFYSAEPPSRKSMQMPVEKKAKRKSSFGALLKSRRSSTNLSEAMMRESRVSSVMLSKRDGDDVEDDHSEDDAEKCIIPGSDELPDPDPEPADEAVRSDAASESESESQFRPGFSAAPTTLLAELQMRKAQQRKRNRTAADAFPNGMHSTLLELDTVAQLQQRARKQKHITLAWEDQDVADKENFNDDDVPLGVLFPEQERPNHVNLGRPLGLMEKRELEENEPLSHRRARLRGEPIIAPTTVQSPSVGQHDEETDKPMLQLSGVGDDDDDDEGETLAQRKQRMKDSKENGVPSDFARHLSSELGLTVEDAGRSGAPTPDPEETLGQRRKRLQAEATQNGSRNVSGGSDGVRPALKTKRSLADVLRAHPVGYVDPKEAQTAQLAMQTQERAREREARFMAAQETDRLQFYASRHKFGNGYADGLIQSSAVNYPGYQPPSGTGLGPFVASNPSLGVFPPSYGYPGVPPHQAHPMYVHPAMSMGNLPMNRPYQQPMPPGYGYGPAVDLTGMGPPLDPKQRARIEGWRQGIL